MGPVHPVPGVRARAAQGHLHHQQHRVAELPAAQDHQEPRPLPQRRRRDQTALPAAEDIDEGTRWGLVWAEHARWVWRSLYNARFALQSLAGEAPDDYEVALIDVFEQWAAHFGTGAEQRATDTNELYDSFEEGERMPIISRPDDDVEG